MERGLSLDNFFNEIQEAIQGDHSPFHRKTGEVAEFPHFLLVDGNDSCIEDDDPPVIDEHRFEVEIEILFSEGEHVFPGIDPAR